MKNRTKKSTGAVFFVVCFSDGLSWTERISVLYHFIWDCAIFPNFIAFLIYEIVSSAIGCRNRRRTWYHMVLPPLMGGVTVSTLSASRWFVPPFWLPRCRDTDCRLILSIDWPRRCICSFSCSLSCCRSSSYKRTSALWHFSFNKALQESSILILISTLMLYCLSDIGMRKHWSFSICILL